MAGTDSSLQVSASQTTKILLIDYADKVATNVVREAQASVERTKDSSATPTSITTTLEESTTAQDPIVVHSNTAQLTRIQEQSEVKQAAVQSNIVHKSPKTQVTTEHIMVQAVGGRVMQVQESGITKSVGQNATGTCATNCEVSITKPNEVMSVVKTEETTTTTSHETVVSDPVIEDVRKASSVENNVALMERIVIPVDETKNPIDSAVAPGEPSSFYHQNKKPTPSSSEAEEKEDDEWVTRALTKGTVLMVKQAKPPATMQKPPLLQFGKDESKTPLQGVADTPHQSKEWQQLINNRGIITTATVHGLVPLNQQQFQPIHLVEQANGDSARQQQQLQQVSQSHQPARFISHHVVLEPTSQLQEVLTGTVVPPQAQKPLMELAVVKKKENVMTRVAKPWQPESTEPPIRGVPPSQLRFGVVQDWIQQESVTNKQLRTGVPWARALQTEQQQLMPNHQWHRSAPAYEIDTSGPVQQILMDKQLNDLYVDTAQGNNLNHDQTSERPSSPTPLSPQQSGFQDFHDERRQKQWPPPQMPNVYGTDGERAQVIHEPPAHAPVYSFACKSTPQQIQFRQHQAKPLQQHASEHFAHPVPVVVSDSPSWRRQPLKPPPTLPKPTRQMCNDRQLQPINDHGHGFFREITTTQVYQVKSVPIQHSSLSFDGYWMAPQRMTQ